jgi:hypothetical protein
LYYQEEQTYRSEKQSEWYTHHRPIIPKTSLKKRLHCILLNDEAGSDLKKEELSTAD